CSARRMTPHLSQQRLLGYITPENLTELVMIQSSRSARSEHSRFGEQACSARRMTPHLVSASPEQPSLRPPHRVAEPPHARLLPPDRLVVQIPRGIGFTEPPPQEVRLGALALAERAAWHSLFLNANLVAMQRPVSDAL